MKHASRTEYTLSYWTKKMPGGSWKHVVKTFPTLEAAMADLITKLIEIPSIMRKKTK